MFLRSFERSLSYTGTLSQTTKACAYFSRWRRPRQDQKANPDRNSSSMKDSLMNQARYPQQEDLPKDQMKVNRFSNLFQDLYNRMMKPKSIYETDEDAYEKLNEDKQSIKDVVFLKMSESFNDWMNKPSYLKSSVGATPTDLSGTGYVGLKNLSSPLIGLKLLHSPKNVSISKKSQRRISLFLLLSILFFMFLERSHRQNRDSSGVGDTGRWRKAFYFLPAPLLYLLLQEEKKRKKKMKIGLLPCPSLDFENYLIPNYLKEPLIETSGEPLKFVDVDSENNFFLKYFEKPAQTTPIVPLEPSTTSENQKADRDEKEPEKKKKNNSSNRVSVDSSNTTGTGNNNQKYVARAAAAVVGVSAVGIAYMLCPPLSIPLLVTKVAAPSASFVAAAVFGRGFLGICTDFESIDEVYKNPLGKKNSSEV